ncbi:phage antirepressor N-terminal domain-containing protein [Nocardia sp. CA-290969]|uniref:phage antirepressor N-terminal domain-containing protein n=1 Tax=Nocardia sp. CA-290969 TaxID=3239986 RepID=UPI003D91A240
MSQPSNQLRPNIGSVGELVPVVVPGASLPIQTDGKRLAALRPVVESLGLDYSGQLQKLKGKSWATVENFSTVGADGKVRDMVGIDRRTVTMWLATLDENRVREEHRADLRAYQAEAADALDAFFHEGGAINPSASVDQLDRLTNRARTQMEIIRLAEGIIDAKHLEAKARIVLARSLGEAPELDPTSRPLYAQSYLAEKGLRRSEVKSISGVFGKRVKAAYVLKYGVDPKKYPLEAENGRIVDANAYTEADRPLMDEVWDRYYAGVQA